MILTLIQFAQSLIEIWNDKDNLNPTELLDKTTDAIMSSVGFIGRQAAQRAAHAILAPYLPSKDF